MEVVDVKIEEQYESFYKTSRLHKTIMPDVVGLPAMDALALLENMGLKVNMRGTGTVKTQSINKGIKVKLNQIIVLGT